MATQQPLANRNNNPGNLRFVGQPGATLGEGGFAKFATPRDGVVALMNDIEYKKSGKSSTGVTGDTTIADYVKKYAPPTENNTRQYVLNMVNDLGVSPYDKLKDVPTQSLAYFHAKHEGYQGYQDLIKKPTIKGTVGPQTASAAETDLIGAQNSQVQPQQPKSLAGSVGGFLSDAFIKPAEQNVQNALAFSGGLGAKLGQVARNALTGQGSVPQQSLQQNIEAQRQPLGEMPTLTETFTGNRIEPRNVASTTGAKQALGDVLSGALTYGTGGTFKTGSSLAKPAAGLLSEKLLSTASQVGKKGIDAINRGAVTKGLGIGAAQGLGLGTAEALQGNKDFTSPSTYGDIAVSGAEGAGLYGGMAGVSKGIQKLSEAVMRRGGNELGAAGNALKRQIGINPLLDTPESKTALDKLKTDELTKTKEKLFPLIQDTAAQGGKMQQVTNKLADVKDDSVALLQKVFAEKPLSKQSFTPGGKINLTEQLNHIGELKRGAGQEMTKIADSLSNSGVKLTTTDILKNLNNITKDGIPGVPLDKQQKVKDTIIQIINNPAYSKNGSINFSKLHDIGVTGNSKYDSDALESVARKYLGKAVKESIKSGSLAKNLLPEQRQALTAYSKALDTFGKVADTEWLAQNMSKANVKGNNLFSSAVGFLSAGATGSPTSPVGVLAYAGGKGITGKLTQAAAKSKLASTVKSKLPADSMTDIVGGLKQEANKAVSGLDLLTNATKVKTAASNRVQKAVKAIDKAENKTMPVIQIGKETAGKAKKKVSDGIKAAAKKTKLPTIQID